MKIKIISLFLILAVVLTGCSKVQGAALSSASAVNAYYPDRFSSISALKGFGVGEAAPDFRYSAAEGQLKSLSQSQGKAILLNFWSSRCPPCREEMPLLEQMYRDQSWRDQGLEMLTVNLDEDSAAAKQFIADNNYSFPFILDSQSVIGNAYGIFEYPSTFFIDKKGVIQFRQEGAFASQGELAAAVGKVVH